MKASVFFVFCFWLGFKPQSMPKVRGRQGRAGALGHVSPAWGLHLFCLFLRPWRLKRSLWEAGLFSSSVLGQPYSSSPGFTRSKGRPSPSTLKPSTWTQELPRQSPLQRLWGWHFPPSPTVQRIRLVTFGRSSWSESCVICQMGLWVAWKPGCTECRTRCHTERVRGALSPLLPQTVWSSGFHPSQEAKEGEGWRVWQGTLQRHIRNWQKKFWFFHNIMQKNPNKPFRPPDTYESVTCYLCFSSFFMIK